ncbi:MAG: PqqD family protein [Propionibacteriales bacterium]|nr:PqqD family protein [Propionibacteriales bacterium]
MLAVGAHVAQARSDQRVALLDLDHLDRPAVILEDSAAAIWEAVDGERSETDVVATVADQFGLDPRSITVDVHELLDDLLARELLVVVR